jgi:hypothetical protein
MPKRFLRYFIGGFEALLALYALMGFGAGLIALIQLSLHPGVGVRRLANVRNGGEILVGVVAASIFGTWFARLAVRNFRDAKALTTGERRRTGKQVDDYRAKIRGIGRKVTVLSGLALFAGVMGYVQTTPTMGGLGHFTHEIFAPLVLCLAFWGLSTGIGLLRAWRWAWISILVFDGLIILACSLLAVPLLLISGEGSSWQNVLVIRAVGVLILALLAAVAVRWFTFFANSTVKAYFGISRKDPIASA